MREQTALQGTLDAQRKEYFGLDGKYVEATEGLDMLRGRLLVEEQNRVETDMVMASEDKMRRSILSQLEAFKRRDRMEWMAVCFRDKKCLLRVVLLWERRTYQRRHVRAAYQARIAPIVLGRALTCWRANVHQRDSWRSFMRQKCRRVKYTWFDTWARRVRRVLRIRRQLPCIGAHTMRECGKIALRQWLCVVEDNARTAYYGVRKIRCKIALTKWRGLAAYHTHLAQVFATAWGFGAEKLLQRCLLAWRFQSRRERFSQLRMWRLRGDLLTTAFDAWGQYAKQRVWITSRLPEIALHALLSRIGKDCFMAFRKWAKRQRGVRFLRERVILSMGIALCRPILYAWSDGVQRASILRRKFILSILSCLGFAFRKWRNFCRLQFCGRRAAAYLVFSARQHLATVWRAWRVWTHRTLLRLRRACTLAARIRLDLLNRVVRCWSQFARRGGRVQEFAMQEKVAELEIQIRGMEQSAEILKRDRSQVAEQLHLTISKHSEERVEADHCRHTLAAYLAEKEEFKNDSLVEIQALKREKDELMRGEKLISSELGDSLETQERLRALLRERESQIEFKQVDDPRVSILTSQLEGLRSAMVERRDTDQAENEKLTAEIVSLRAHIRSLEEQLEHQTFCMRACELELRRVKYEESLRVS